MHRNIVKLTRKRSWEQRIPARTTLITRCRRVAVGVSRAGDTTGAAGALQAAVLARGAAGALSRWVAVGVGRAGDTVGAAGASCAAVLARRAIVAARLSAV